MLESTPLIFLDIDGVLNNSQRVAGVSHRPMIDPQNVEPFNRIVAETQAKVVVSSSWRSMIQPDFMTLKGFEMMLLTHRIRCNLIGITPISGDVRGKQVSQYIANTNLLFRNNPVGRYLVLDDDDDEISQYHPLVQTNGRTGLTSLDAERVISALMGDVPPSAGRIKHCSP